MNSFRVSVMRSTENELRDESPVTDDLQLHGLLTRLLGAARQRQIWLVFFDEQSRLLDPIMPMSDHPYDPEVLHETEDLGLVSFPEMFVHRARQIAEMVNAVSFALIWERPGGEKYTHDDLDWARAFIDRAGDRSDLATLRALFLLHDHGLRQVVPDDYL